MLRHYIKIIRFLVFRQIGEVSKETQRHWEEEDTEDDEGCEDGEHKKGESFWNSLIYFRFLYQPIEGAVKATEVV
jgi:hypothetical protein